MSLIPSLHRWIEDQNTETLLEQMALYRDQSKVLQPPIWEFGGEIDGVSTARSKLVALYLSKLQEISGIFKTFLNVNKVLLAHKLVPIESKIYDFRYGMIRCMNLIKWPHYADLGRLLAQKGIEKICGRKQVGAGASKFTRDCLDTGKCAEKGAQFVEEIKRQYVETFRAQKWALIDVFDALHGAIEEPLCTEDRKIQLLQDYIESSHKIRQYVRTLEGMLAMLFTASSEVTSIHTAMFVPLMSKTEQVYTERTEKNILLCARKFNMDISIGKFPILARMEESTCLRNVMAINDVFIDIVANMLSHLFSLECAVRDYDQKVLRSVAAAAAAEEKEEKTEDRVSGLRPLCDERYSEVEELPTASPVSVSCVKMNSWFDDLLGAIPRKGREGWDTLSYDNAYRVLIDLSCRLKKPVSALEYISMVGQLSYILEQRLQAEAMVKCPTLKTHSLRKLVSQGGIHLTYEQMMLVVQFNYAEIFSRTLALTPENRSEADALMHRAYACHIANASDLFELHQSFLDAFGVCLTLFGMKHPKRMLITVAPPIVRERIISAHRARFEHLDARNEIKNNLFLLLDRLADIHDQLMVESELIVANVTEGLQLCSHVLETTCAYLLYIPNPIHYEHNFEAMLTDCHRWESLSSLEKQFLKQQSRLRHEVRGYRESEVLSKAMAAEESMKMGKTRTIRVAAEEAGIAVGRGLKYMITRFQETYDQTIRIAAKLVNSP